MHCQDFDITLRTILLLVDSEALATDFLDIWLDHVVAKKLDLHRTKIGVPFHFRKAHHLVIASRVGQPLLATVSRPHYRFINSALPTLTEAFLKEANERTRWHASDNNDACHHPSPNRSSQTLTGQGPIVMTWFSQTPIDDFQLAIIRFRSKWMVAWPFARR